jgi:hypothetical protein
MGVGCMGKACEILLVVCVAFMVVSVLGVQVVFCNGFDYDCDQDIDPWGFWGNRAEIYGYYSTNPLRYGSEDHIAQAWTSWPMVVLEGDVDFIGINGQQYHVHFDIAGLDYYESAHYDYYTGSVITKSDAEFYNSILGNSFWSRCTAGVIAGRIP